MKRIILLLLLLTCFRISYGEELSAEQQRLAWKFILDSFRPGDYLPNTFKTDIVINLKGEVTSEDSVFIKDLILHVQGAIPSLKIELSAIPGNFIFGLNDGKWNTINTNMNKKHELSSVGIYLPVPENLSKKEREQFIYFHFLQGFTSFFYSKLSVPGLSGCIFTEKNFKSITFSPVDLYIIQQLYSPDFPVLLAKNLDINGQQSAWKYIQSKFIDGLKDPIIFHDHISIKLTGNINHKDSAIFKKLTDELNEILPDNRKIFFTNSDARQTFSIQKFNTNQSNTINYNDIIWQKTNFVIPNGTDDENRLKIIYYYLYRALVYNPKGNNDGQKVDGCIFDEDSPGTIAFHPYDKFILSKLYAPDFQDQFKAYFIKTSSLKEYYKFRFKDQLPVIGISGGFIFAILLVSILISLNVFHKHNWKFKSFLIQVIWGIVSFNVFFLFDQVVQSFGFKFYQSNLIALFILDLIILMVSIASFVIEKKIQFSTLSSKTRSILLLINTIFIFFIALYLLLHFIAKQSGLHMIFLCIFITLIITTARFFMISLSGLSRAEIKQKDNELILLKEKNKQAELQSLRAKINPHFLYNALNSIASLATTDARKTEQMALALSDFFKYAINREQKQLNTLSEELNATRTYLEIEKVRFGDRLSFEIDCPPELLDIQIPQLLIQPLVENAIKHGLSQITENGLIRISVSKTENQLKIRVYDNGPAFPDGPLTGFGIQNTQERIALLYGEKASVNWVNGAEKYIELNLPSVNEPI